MKPATRPERIIGKMSRWHCFPRQVQSGVDERIIVFPQETALPDALGTTTCARGESQEDPRASIISDGESSTTRSVNTPRELHGMRRRSTDRDPQDFAARSASWDAFRDRHRRFCGARPKPCQDVAVGSGRATTGREPWLPCAGQGPPLAKSGVNCCQRARAFSPTDAGLPPVALEPTIDDRFLRSQWNTQSLSLRRRRPQPRRLALSPDFNLEVALPSCAACTI